MSWRWRVALAVALTVPGLVLRIVPPVPAAVQLLLDGGSVVAAAFLLGWAVETAEVDLSGGLAVAILALVAILPEFVVGIYFAYEAGRRPAYAQFATANVTGSIRLLLGLGIGLTTMVFAIGQRRRERHARAGGVPGAPPPRRRRWYPEERPLQVAPAQRLELGFVVIASAFAVVIAAGHQIAWWESVVLAAIYAAYLWRVARAPSQAPDLIGVPAALGALPGAGRRIAVGALFGWAALIVLSAAAPFASAILAVGARLRIDQFLLVQWVAPLASEAPELLIAVVLALRAKPSKGIATLLSSTINQWTLAIGALPVAYLLGGGHGALPLSGRQPVEFTLTIAQAVLAVAVLIDLRVGRWEAITLFALFVLQFAVPGATGRLVLAGVYLGFAAALLVIGRHGIGKLATALRGRVSVVSR